MRSEHLALNIADAMTLAFRRFLPIVMELHLDEELVLQSVEGCTPFLRALILIQLMSSILGH